MFCILKYFCKSTRFYVAGSYSKTFQDIAENFPSVSSVMCKRKMNIFIGKYLSIYEMLNYLIS